MRTIGVLGVWLVTACASTTAKHSESSDDWARREVVASPRHTSARASAAPTVAREAMPAFGSEAGAPSAEHQGADTAPITASPRAVPGIATVKASTAFAAEPPTARAHSSSEGAAAPKAAEDPRQRAADRKVQVAGIEGTLASFDVRVTMDGKSREFGACHAPRLRKVPSLGGDVEFKIRVLADGSVASVAVPSSNVGDRALERCFTGVIMATTFPKPHGGDANVSYTMSLGVARPGREPEVWEADRIRHIVDKRADDVREMCDLSSPRSYHATVYVNRRGKIISAGVAGKSDQSGALDCIAEAVRKWPMPKSRKKAFAKVSFPMIGAS